ncbi:creatinine amidohydrolase [Arthrobacter ginsengisoli]|uniref:Creatinine amidohydrolase n=1 Tax=Arthrobacter ginsengisoli TaxID=1356565 RepID=A0ABU1UDF8_9MICC|nr:mycofactocin biosynthesis peptidyl-dipeptidase MftE [Arthrobacter ginsengisoli]MDR7083211.1 creatinine amidohydrolase [Arthrobacter ginsengisoli]
MTGVLAETAWPAISDDVVVLVPLGSTEQHGPHLPFATDSTISAEVARGAAERCRGLDGSAPLIVAPALPYGASGEHQAFPGTVSIGTEALQVVLIELVRSLATWADGIIFVNGHGGNIQALSTAVPQLIAEQHRVAWLPCAVPDGDAHAGHTETSLMLHLAPQQVDMSLARAGNVAPMRELLPVLAASGTRAVSPSGVLGDPTGASAAEGSVLLGSMIDSVLRRIAGGSVDQRGCLRDPGAGGVR